MKKILLPFLIFAGLLQAGFIHGQAGSITIGIRGNACDQLVVEWNSTYNFVGAGQNQWTQSTMTISWPQSLGASTLGAITSFLPGFTGWQYNGDATLVGTEYRREVILISGGYTQDIPIGVTEVIAITLNGSGTGDFNLSFFNPAGIQSTNISSGNHAGEMWSGTFNPGSATGVNLDDRIAWDGTKWCGGSGSNYQPGPGDTKPCFITGLNGQLTVWGATVGSLTVQVGGELTIMPGASLTNNGVTTISQPMGLVIGANSTGSGSFIDNGTIVYSGSGSSKVQTYINNVAPIGEFHIHQIGPTVKNPSFSVDYPGESGIYLEEFDLQSLGTYAYRYSEPSNNWVNIYQNAEPIPTGGGVILSDVSGTPSTLEMVGQLASDGALGYITTPSAISSLPQWAVSYTSAGGQGNMLFSNPYPSGLDLKLVYTDYALSSVVGTTMRVWQHGLAGGTYGNYSYVQRKTSPPAGWLYLGALQATQGVINPGQGFFMELLSNYISTNGDQFYFYNTLRAHLNSPFIKESQELIPNLLKLKALSNYSQDELIIYFSEGASSGYEENDAVRWASLYDWSLEVGTIATDGNELAINAMPSLSNQMYSIPMNFKCGSSGVHTFEFTDLESFDAGTEIYLEDKIIGGNWINLVLNPAYEFNANTGDPLERFVLHFFGPTGVSDPNTDANNAISIYGYGQDAYIVNRGTETVKEYVAYDMMGRELHRGTLPNNTVNKVTIGDVNAYYIVKVITKEGRIYTDKVYINQ